MDEKPDIPGVIAPPPLIYGVPLAVLLVVHHKLQRFDIPLEMLSWPLRAFAGAFTVIAGATLLVLAVGTFRRADTPPEPWKATRTLTRAGPYRLTRNPMYLGMTFVYAGIALISGCLLVMGALVPILFVVDRFVIAREEAYLERRFGQPYRDWLAHSRRWL